MVSVFATKFLPTLDSETLASYLKDKLDREVTCQKLDIGQSQFSSFKVIKINKSNKMNWYNLALRTKLVKPETTQPYLVHRYVMLSFHGNQWNVCIVVDVCFKGILAPFPLS